MLLELTIEEKEIIIELLQEAGRFHVLEEEQENLLKKLLTIK